MEIEIFASQPDMRGNKIMKKFDVQGVDLHTTREMAFSYIADPMHLPQWTNAFASVTGRRAVMRTPNGEIEIDLMVRSSEEQGTVDWFMTFPDGSVATAFSRVVELDPEHCAYTFVLTPPPVPLEQLEGTLKEQSRILAEELQNLKRILERHG